jgi:sugar O-acyltransferase (sialic acid O-acetyltransferase NeuD family)
MKNILIIGSSGHAEVIIDIIEKCKDFRIVGLIDSFRKPGETTFNYPVLGGLDKVSAILSKYHVKTVFIAVGSNWNRHILQQELLKKNPDLKFATLIHPNSVIGRNVTIGSGSVVMAGAIINPNAVIGNQCIVNTSASIDHDCKLDDFSSLAPGVTLGGNVHIKEFCTIGLGAKLIHKITVGKHTLIGAGSLVIKDIPDHKVAYGVPSEIIKERAEEEEIY